MLKVYHLCFADDLIMNFSEGDHHSMFMTLRRFATFSSSFGLEANKGRSELYGSNIEDNPMQRIVQASGFNLDRLTFKYLGVLISSQRLKIGDCDMLTERIISKIRLWGSRNMSYSARIVLVNTVLLNLHSYWVFIFVIPKTVVKKIISIYRNFFWDGKIIANGNPLVSWESMCKDKKDGGLGIRDYENWNLVAICKLVMNVTTKVDTLWVKWLHQVYVKDQDWWMYNPTTESSLVWRKICKVKSLFASTYNGHIWNGKSNNVYTVNSGCEWLKEESPKVHWNVWIWNNINIPNHGFVCWLIRINKIKTKGKLVRLGVVDDN